MSNYSSTFMDHFSSPRNACRMESPDRVGKSSTRGRAPYVTIELKIHRDLVTEATFQTFGCGAAIAAGSALTEMVKGRRVDECLGLTADQLAESLGGMPSNKRFCADLAISALRNGLED